MKLKRQLIPVLLCLLLCGCGQNKIQAVPGSSDISERTAPVYEGSAVESIDDTEVSEEGYRMEYYTSEEASVAEIIQSNGAPSEGKEADAGEEKETAVKEYASCLYPEHTPSAVETTDRQVNGKNYLFFAVKDEASVYCTIAYDEQEDIFYLYDSEVEQLIPIEYDQYGIRLVG